MYVPPPPPRPPLVCTTAFFLIWGSFFISYLNLCLSAAYVPPPPHSSHFISFLISSRRCTIRYHTIHGHGLGLELGLVLSDTYIHTYVHAIPFDIQSPSRSSSPYRPGGASRDHIHIYLSIYKSGRTLAAETPPRARDTYSSWLVAC